ILEYYLNTINLGAGTYGVQTASKEYFGKTVSELNVAEAAVIASITQQPTALNPIEHPKKNKTRMLHVLKKMYEQKYITKSEYNKAKKDKVYDRIKSVDMQKEKSNETTINSYFVDALYRQVQEDLVEIAGYDREDATAMLNYGGLQIYSTQDSNMQAICDDIINDPSNYNVSDKYQLVYALSVTNKKGVVKNYDHNHLKAYFKETKGESTFDLLFSNKEDADKYIKEYKEHILNDDCKFIADKVSFTLQPQVSFTLIDQATGEVKAICGGRGEKTSSLSLNRATDSDRQPGSTFKILASYLPALDTSGMTLATVKDDNGPYNNIKTWRTHYKGLTTLREGIWDSNNVVAAKTYDDVTSSVALNYINNLGITSLTPEDVGASVALGGSTKGVKNLELTAAYAAIANHGTYKKPHFYTKVVDSTGNVILEHKDESKQVMKETTAWLLTDAMHDVVTRGTGTSANFSGMYVAGKTGTSTGNRDLWFAGFTPYYTASIWTGYDLYDKEVGGTSSNHHK
ncbi:MAG: transglycosylase domain-containing protein, partial [Clostridia bacterium]|nr:transglycosylase domain-containing protein [Clostridia bacterium]